MQGAAVSGRALRELVDELVDDGASLRTIEREVVEDAPLGEDARDALWLYAWGSVERRAQRPAVFA
ncbi:MAG: hypothetical protein JWM73_2915 [Solirubrobacterales bacterium]|nr:hypothetical protein [Solirubrobacterales bacterium]